MSTRSFKILLSLLFGALLVLPLTMQAQLFQLNGDAIDLGDDCYQLTESLPSEAGSVWRLEQIDLTQDFRVNFQMNLGCQDGNGADGMAFAFQPISTTIGTGGGGMGILGVSPSLAVEFDTYTNGNYNDPSYDHVAISRDGVIDHDFDLAGPETIIDGNNNAEDCTEHEVHIFWTAISQTLYVYVDCVLRVSYTGDVIDDVFGGDPMVYWGLTSATGALHNVHSFCFEYIAETELEDLSMCLGEELQVNLDPDAGDYTWFPFDGVSDPSIPNPILTPTETTTYTVQVNGNTCGFSTTDEITVFVNSVEVDLGADVEICGGTSTTLTAVEAPDAGTTFAWSTGETTNSITVSTPMIYSVTVTENGCSGSDEVEVLALPTLTNTADTLACEGGTVFFDGSEYAVGGHVINYTSAQGCDSLLVLTVEPVSVSIGAVNTLPACFGENNGSIQSAVVSSPSGAFTVTITAEDGTLLSDTALTVGTHTYTVTDNVFGCTDEISITVDGIDCSTECTTAVPTGFSPNYDGINDVLLPVYDCDLVEWSIYDRWGNQVFKTTDPDQAWDGFSEGKKMPLGVYAYSLQIIHPNTGEQLRYAGNVSLLR